MKKLFLTLLLSSLCALTFAAPKKGKSNNIKLDPKKKFAIEGVELGSLEEAQVCASVNNKGEIIWNQDCDWNFFGCGWELRGIDMSKYAGLKFELASSMEQRVRIKVENPACTGTSAVVFDENKQAYVFFNGSNASWHEGDAWTDINKPDPAEGYKIFVSIEAKDKAINTVFKSIELLSKEDYPDADELKILGVPFGSQIWKARITGNEITWLKGDTGGDAGWNFVGIDLSEYDRVRIEIESNTAAHLGLRICDSEHNNWHGYDRQIEPNVYEADLSGEGASWLGIYPSAHEVVLVESCVSHHHVGQVARGVVVGKEHAAEQSSARACHAAKHAAEHAAKHIASGVSSGSSSQSQQVA